MDKLWFTSPKEVTTTRGKGIQIEQSSGNSNHSILGVDGGLTLSEAEDLLWRLKQGIDLLIRKHA